MEDAGKPAIVPVVHGRYADKHARELLVTEINKESGRGRDVVGILTCQEFPNGAPYSTSFHIFAGLWTIDLNATPEVKGV